jgi:hypothetical protein
MFTNLRVTRWSWITVKETENNPCVCWQPLARHRCSGEDDVKMNRRKTGWEGMDRICMVQDRDGLWGVMNTIMSLQVSVKCGEFLQ